MRTDIFSTRTTKPICNFANSGLTCSSAEERTHFANSANHYTTDAVSQNKSVQYILILYRVRSKNYGIFSLDIEIQTHMQFRELWVNMLTSSAEERGFETRSGQTIDSVLEIKI
jgi:hypothetical protein